MHRRLPFYRILSAALLIALVMGLAAQPALAVPPLPADFWGYVMIDGSPAPNGTVVAATVNGVTFQTTTALSSGQALYLLSVNGDDPATSPAAEGGAEGQAITFQVGGVAVSQSGVWHTGSNTRLDLARVTAPAAIASLTPAAAGQGTSAAVTVVGSNTHFAAGVTQVSFGAGVTVNSVTVSSPTQLTANISVLATAAAGKRDVSAVTGSETASKANAFSVTAVGLEAWLPSAATGAVGDQVSIPITIPTNSTGVSVIAYSFRVTADAAVLQFEGVDSAGTLSSGWSVQERHDTPGEISVVAFGTSYLGSNGVLIKLLGRVTGSNGDGTALEFHDFAWNEGSPNALPQNGYFTSSGLGIVGRVLYMTGTLPVSNTVLTLAGGAAMTTTSGTDGVYRLPVAAGKSYSVTPSGLLRYQGGAISALDAARVAQCVLGLRPMTDCPLNTANVSNSGGVSAYDASLIARYAVGLTSPKSIVGYWVYEPHRRNYSNVQVSQLDQNYAGYLRGDVTGNWEAATVANAEAGADSVRLSIVEAAEMAESGQLITPLHLAAPTATDLVAYQFELSYDPALLQFAGTDAAGTLSEGWEVVWNEDAPGHVLVGAFAAQPLAGEGDLLRLLFGLTGASDSLAAFATIHAAPVAFNEGAVVLPVTPDFGPLLGQNLYLPAISTSP